MATTKSKTRRRRSVNLLYLKLKLLQLKHRPSKDKPATNKPQASKVVKETQPKAKQVKPTVKKTEFVKTEMVVGKAAKKLVTEVPFISDVRENIPPWSETPVVSTPAVVKPITQWLPHL